MIKRRILSLALLAVTVVLANPALAAAKPNILVIWGDDIGWSNISAYNHGMMGYKIPSIDRLAQEGAMFTDFYGQRNGYPFQTGASLNAAGINYNTLRAQAIMDRIEQTEGFARPGN